MARYQYEKLSSQDNDFLVWEQPNLPMHVGGTQIFDAGPLRNEYGGIDFEAVKRLTESVLHLIPRYRQKLAWIPGEDHAVWVDDDHFNVNYHFRHTSLPRPGTDDQLKRLTARLMEQPLDRGRPLWETWVIEGLEGDRFAMVSKIHHCMIDGASGVDLSQLLLSREPRREIAEAPPFIPRPQPKPSELVRDERRQKILAPLAAMRSVYEFARDTENPGDVLLRRARAAGELFSFSARGASETPINGEVGPHRIVDWTSIPLADMKAVRRALDCTINDVVLTVVTGAVRKLMQRRQVQPETLDFRVSTPVNVRTSADAGHLGNKVSSWLVRLPLDAEDPLEQLRVIHERTQELKHSSQAEVVGMFTKLTEWLPINIQSLSVGTVNTIVTNVPGPPFPLYLLGSRLRQITPFAPLLENVGLVIGALSYDGTVFWGFNADYDSIPDLADFRRAIDTAFARLVDAAGVELPSAREGVTVEIPAVAGTIGPALSSENVSTPTPPGTRSH
jgi:WS/DGAT/MGAT family acyltransferase